MEQMRKFMITLLSGYPQFSLVSAKISRRTVLESDMTSHTSKNVSKRVLKNAEI